jgi:hypothetical protein
MTAWLPYVLLNTAGIFVFMVAWWLTTFGTRWRLAAAGVVLGLIILKSILTWMPVWEATLFPFSGYIYLQLFWMPLLIMAFFGVAAPQWAVAWNRVAIALIAFVFYVHLLNGRNHRLSIDLPDEAKKTRLSHKPNLVSHESITN